MTRKTLKDALAEISRYFEAQQNAVFRKAEIDHALQENRDAWNVPPSTTTGRFISFLTANARMTKVRLEFPSRNELRYIWGDASPYEIAGSLREGCYFSHFSAMFIHALTKQTSMNLYVNSEQTPKPKPSGELEQAAIDRAFANGPRRSKCIAQYGKWSICLLSGKNTGNAGVIDTIAPDGTRVRVTNLERTLIDAAVRSFYSGGVFEVLESYKACVSEVSAAKLTAILKKLDHVYPYHQAIGFYLEKAGLPKEKTALLQKFGLEHDFYLDFQMKETEYSDKWRLYYPKGL